MKLFEVVSKNMPVRRFFAVAPDGPTAVKLVRQKLVGMKGKNYDVRRWKQEEFVAKEVPDGVHVS